MGSPLSEPVEKRTFKTSHFISEYKEFVCGWGAATVNILITFPLNKVIFRQMLHNMSTADAVKQIASEGIFRLYRGVLPPLLQKSISLSIMFGMYDRCKRPLAETNLHPFLVKVLAAISAGSLEGALTPFERIQTLLQHERYHTHLINMKDTVFYLWRTHGFKEFYRGTIPILLRNGPANACFFCLRDEAMEKLPEARTVAGRVISQFAIGAMIGAFCSTIFYPFNVVKVHLQRKIGGPFQSFPSAVLEIYTERGNLRGFFRGVHLNYTRSCISWGVINVSYEGLKKML